GYLSYDAVRWFEQLPETSRDELHLPDAVFLFGDVVSVFDNLTHTMKVVTHARGGSDPDKSYDVAVERLNAEVERLRKPLAWIEPPSWGEAGEPVSTVTRERYMASVE